MGARSERAARRAINVQTLAVPTYLKYTGSLLPGPGRFLVVRKIHLMIIARLIFLDFGRDYDGGTCGNTRVPPGRLGIARKSQPVVAELDAMSAAASPVS